MGKVKKIAILFFCLVFLSCTQIMYKAPFVLTNPECIIGSLNAVFMFAGVQTSFYNNSDKNIVKLCITFNVYDQDTKKNPFVGSNHICSTYTDSIYSLESVELIISLDNLLHSPPDKKYCIENFCIESIFYEDGSEWHDYVCAFSVDSK